jgi:hypothetical protein
VERFDRVETLGRGYGEKSVCGFEVDENECRGGIEQLNEFCIPARSVNFNVVAA